MLDVGKAVSSARALVVKNEPIILLGMGLSGFVGTVVLAVRATPKAEILLNEEKVYQLELANAQLDDDDNFITANNMTYNKLDIFKRVAPVYIPTLVLGGVSIACILGSYHVGTKRTAALGAAYSIAEKTLSEYQNKVIETIGSQKETDIRDAIAKDHVDKDIADKPVSNILTTRDGNTLCFDDRNGRWFYSDIAKLKAAQNQFNHDLLCGYSNGSLNDFYMMIGLDPTGDGDNLGWARPDQLELVFSYVPYPTTEEPAACINFSIDPYPGFENFI
jgi:hypothetical protein